MKYQNHNPLKFSQKTTFQFFSFLFAFLGLFIFSINISQGEGVDSYTKLLLHGDGTGNSFTDSSSGNKSITANGDVTQSVTQSKFGGKSIYFDGWGDYLTVPDSDDWSLGLGDFAIDSWVYLTNKIDSQDFVGQYVDERNYWKLYIASSTAPIRFINVSSGSNTIMVTSLTPTGISLNTWTHLAVTRNGTTFKLFVNGVDVTGTGGTDVDTVTNFAGELKIGRVNTDQNYFVNGYLEELRISKGIARWTSNFTPPTSAYSSIDPEKTLTNPTPEDIEEDITAGIISVSGTNTEATGATINTNYTLQTGSYQYLIPSGTTITPTSGTMDITALAVSDISQTIQEQNSNSKGAIKIGIPNKNVTFSQDITVTLDISSDYNNKTLAIYSRPDNGETWTNETTCLVTDGQCSFTTDHATQYTANYEVSNSPTPTDVNLDLTATISLVCTDSVTLGTITGTGQSNLTTNEASCNVRTINSSGYQLSWLSSTPYLENENGDQIAAYTPQTPDTPRSLERLFHRKRMGRTHQNHLYRS